MVLFSVSICHQFCYFCTIDSIFLLLQQNVSTECNDKYFKLANILNMNKTFKPLMQYRNIRYIIISHISWSKDFRFRVRG